MLGQKTVTQALLGNNSNKSGGQAGTKSSLPPPQESRVNVDNQNVQARESIKTQKESKRKKKSKKNQTQFTTVLKFFNIFIGLGVVAFGASCYKFFNQDTKKLDLVGVILPGYIAFSGLIILLIECNIGFIVRNMKFLYNFIGRGLFNIYVGVMPLSLVRLNQDPAQNQTFQVIIFIMVSLMCLVGVLYILAKIFCCAKEDGIDKKKRKRRYSSDSSESDDDQ